MKNLLVISPVLVCFLLLLAVSPFASAAPPVLRLAGSFMQYQEEMKTWPPAVWRQILDEYSPPRVGVAEAWVMPGRSARYVRPDELHQAFNFDFLQTPWDCAALVDVIEASLREARGVGATATWVLSNHDVTRPVTRYGRADTSFSFEGRRAGTPTDLARGTRRARAAALLSMALPGSLYVYQGEELGLPEVEDIPAERRHDPMWFRSGGLDPGRDGCRVPLPWAGSRPPYGFSAAGTTTPWLEQPGDWAPLTVEAQSGAPESMLELYRAGLHARRSAPWGDGAELEWQPSIPDVLAFRRGERFVCLVNFGPDPVKLPAGADVLIASNELEGGAVPHDTTVWLRQAEVRPARPSRTETSNDSGQGKEGR